MNKFWKVVFASLILMLLVYWEVARREAEITYSTPIVPLYQSQESDYSEQPPEFHLKTLSGKDVRLEDFKGHPILLNFWASWCQPCVEEFPSLLDLAEKGAKTWGLVVLAVSEDENSKDIGQMFENNKWRRSGGTTSWGLNSLPLTIIMDPGAKVASTYGTSKFPETFFINRNFVVKRKFIGSRNWTSQEMLKWLEENL